MSGLSQDAKLLVAEARGQGDPSREDRARLQAKLAPAWAAYEREQQLNAARSSRGRWTATATRWLLCASLAWLAPHVEEARAVVAPNLQATGVAPLQLSAAEVSSAQLEPALRLPAANLHTRVARGSSAREDGPGARTSEMRGRVPGSSNALPGTREVGRASESALSSPAGRAREVGRASNASLGAGTSEAREADSASRTLPARVQNDASSAPKDEAQPAAWRAPARLQPTAAERGAAEVERADHAPPEQGGPQRALQPIGDELELLGVAQDALRKHQPSVALRLVQQHAFRFPRGALTRERQAVQILALCALQRLGPARAVFEDLSQSAGDSPTLESVRRACGF